MLCGASTGGKRAAIFAATAAKTTTQTNLKIFFMYTPKVITLNFELTTTSPV